MRTLLSIVSIAIFFLTAAPAFAADFLDDDVPTIPEPSVLALFGIGAAAYLVSRRGKK